MSFHQCPLLVVDLGLSSSFLCWVNSPRRLHAEDVYEAFLYCPQLPILLEDGFCLFGWYVSHCLARMEVSTPVALLVSDWCDGGIRAVALDLMDCDGPVPAADDTAVYVPHLVPQCPHVPHECQLSALGKAVDYRFAVGIDNHLMNPWRTSQGS